MINFVILSVCTNFLGPGGPPPIYASLSPSEKVSSSAPSLNTPSPSNYGSTSSPSTASLEKYSTILIAELKKRPQKEKALQDALDLQERIRKIEAHLSQVNTNYFIFCKIAFPG
jgi:hypothetical protein